MWCMAEIPAAATQRQKNQKFKAFHGHLVSSELVWATQDTTTKIKTKQKVIKFVIFVFQFLPFKKILKSTHVCFLASVHICTRECRCLRKLEASPGAGDVVVSHWCGCWELNPGPCKSTVSSEPALSHLASSCYIFIFT